MCGFVLLAPPSQGEHLIISFHALREPRRAELRGVLVNPCEQNEKLVPENEDAVLDLPTSVTMSDVIEARRKRLANRATAASRPTKLAALT
jgi:hypothetical protein